MLIGGYTEEAKAWREWLVNAAAGGFGNAVALADPSERATFSACKLDWSFCDIQSPFVQRHRDLLYLRRTDPNVAQQDSRMIHVAILNPDCFILRWHNPINDVELDRLVVVNLGQTYAGVLPRSHYLRILEVTNGPSCFQVKFHSTAVAVLHR